MPNTKLVKMAFARLDRLREAQLAARATAYSEVGIGTGTSAMQVVVSVDVLEFRPKVSTTAT